MKKKIDFILKGRGKSIGEETVLQPLPHKDFRFASPFIVLHHLPNRHFNEGSPPVRVHPHPHRGFAPVTFMFKGEGFHKDTQGYSSVLKEGGVQWMFAGKGLLHSEGPTDELLQKGGDYEFVQLWVNVPAKYKMDEPFYQEVSKEQMPSLFDEEGIDIKLASGRYEQYTGLLKSFTPVTAAFGSVRQGKTVNFIAREGYWTLLYILEGTALVNEQEVTEHHLVVFSKDATEISFIAKANTRLLYLSAEPINEPVAAKGNMVMNTPEEIEQAEMDYAAGKFGTLDF